ncbi:choline/ethanolaminephosphotransferase 1-like isoform X2 [Dysidea avara]|uniref:choline/ethanolaminephosphotransferase 1-like isoform X2 n=1 Tax=Dysidea avara TaxID=196820 RepID=UPI00332CCCD1
MVVRRLTSHQVQKLEKHVYKSEGVSLLDPYLQVCWEWMFTHIPLWVHPNVLTVCGLMANFIAALFVIYYDPNILGKSLDALDGKQARRSDCDDPLAELFDHGCDSMSNIFVLLCCGSALGLSESPNMFLALMALQLSVFYCCHWQCHSIERMRVRWIDVTEAQLLIMAVHMITFLGGVDTWRMMIFGKFELRNLLLTAVSLSGMINICQCLVAIMTDGRKIKGNNITILYPAIPLAAVLIGGFSYSCWSQFNESNVLLYVMVFGVPLVKLTITLIVSCITETLMPPFDLTMLAPLVAFSNIYFNFLLSEYLLFALLSVFTLVDLLFSYTFYCREISGHLNLAVFSLPKPSKQ